MSRKKSREVVLCLVFEREYHREKDCEKLFSEAYSNNQLTEIYNSFADEESKTDEPNGKPIISIINEKDLSYIKNVFFGVFNNVEQIDKSISDSIIGWEKNRISKVSMALLRIAVYEILYENEIPTNVSINEAVELSKKYDQSDAYTFINGVLGGILKSLPKAEKKQSVSDKEE